MAVDMQMTDVTDAGHFIFKCTARERKQPICG